MGINVLVAAPDVASHAPDHAFDVENFTYDKEKDLYICPANQMLTTNGTWYNKSRGKSVTRLNITSQENAQAVHSLVSVPQIKKEDSLNVQSMPI